MSLTSENLLIISEALHDKCAAGDDIDTVFPTATMFEDKASYRNFLGTLNTTRFLIETNIVRAVWISFLRFEDLEQNTDSPVFNVIYQLTLFTETNFERLDQTVTPDAFNKKVARREHEHDTAVFSLKTQFQGHQPLTLTGDFAEAETWPLAQIDNTERDVNCPFISDPTVTGSVTKLMCTAKIQLTPC